jgi:hypothetical protein
MSVSTGPSSANSGAARHPVPAALLHDLRTPLGQIIGYAELLVERAQDAGDETFVADLQKVSAAGYRMVALLEKSFAAEPAPASAAGTQNAAEPRLSAFILGNREAILAEWEAFARTCTPAAAPMGIVALRDHAREMLTVIAADLDTPQGARAQAEEHGAGRAESGFTIEQVVSEYRALRASVIRLWSTSRGALGPGDLHDLMRFNEAIDQALAESVTRYTQGWRPGRGFTGASPASGRG